VPLVLPKNHQLYCWTTVNPFRGIANTVGHAKGLPVGPILTTLALGFLGVSLHACDCSRYPSSGPPMEIQHRSSKLTLAWDPPATDLPGTATEVVSYVLYYREHGTDYWHVLDHIAASRRPEYTLEVSRVGEGLYDFGVRALSVNGMASPLHSSLDNSADPISGWFVLWISSK
jgi:hypothetical protein